jgi:hypothetical protein
VHTTIAWSAILLPMSNITVTGMSLFVWRTVVSLLGGFPALRDAAGTKGESSTVGGGLLRAYRNWQLILSTFAFAYLHLLLSVPYPAFGGLKLLATWIYTESGFLEESWDNGEKQSSALATLWRSYLRRASRRSGRIWSRAPRTCWRSCLARMVRRRR